MVLGTLFQPHREKGNTRTYPGHRNHSDGSEQARAQEVAAKVCKAAQPRGAHCSLAVPSCSSLWQRGARVAEARQRSKSPPGFTYGQGAQGHWASHSMTQTLLLLCSAGLGNCLQPTPRDEVLIPVPCSQQKAHSAISIQISRPNHMTV